MNGLGWMLLLIALLIWAGAMVIYLPGNWIWLEIVRIEEGEALEALQCRFRSRFRAGRRADTKNRANHSGRLG